MAWQDASDSGASVCPLVSIARARSAQRDRVFGLQACVVMVLTLALLTLHTLECPSGAVLSGWPIHPVRVHVGSKRRLVIMSRVCQIGPKFAPTAGSDRSARSAERWVAAPPP